MKSEKWTNEEQGKAIIRTPSPLRGTPPILGWELYNSSAKLAEGGPQSGGGVCKYTLFIIKPKRNGNKNFESGTPGRGL